jgi:hypothetical protein
LKVGDGSMSLSDVVLDVVRSPAARAVVVVFWNDVGKIWPTANNALTGASGGCQR